MKSSFHRMFQYAKRTQSEALEDFTTEALAFAIRHDPTPMVNALKTLKGLQTLDPSLSVVGTQVHRSCGRLDLVLHAHQHAQPLPIWVEIKVDADESGDQLTNYQEAIRILSEDGQPTQLITLRRQTERLKEGVENLSWQTLADHIPGDACLAWLDFKAFLQERRIAARPHTPVSQATARSILEDFAHQANALLKQKHSDWTWAFPTGQALDEQLKLSSTNHQKWTLHMSFRHLEDLVGCGFMEQDFGLWVHNDLKMDRKRHLGIRQALLDQGRQLPSDPWRLDSGHPYIALARTQPWDNSVSNTEAVAWLMEGLHEVCEANILQTLHERSGKPS